jgi:hypothetical protein
MKLIHSSVYSFILDEGEWYGATEQQQEAWINQITRQGKEADALHLAIFVQPAELLSISPIAKRHKVWGHTFPSSAQELLSIAISKALHESECTHSEKKAILRTYMESYR